MEECAGIEPYPLQYSSRLTQNGVMALSVLARTCRCLQELALDLLWYRQSTPENLMKTLPGDLLDYLDSLEGSEELASAV